MAGEEERAFERLSGLSKSGRSSTDRGALGSIFQSAVGIEEEWGARFWACTLSGLCTKCLCTQCLCTLVCLHAFAHFPSFAVDMVYILLLPQALEGRVN